MIRLVTVRWLAHTIDEGPGAIRAFEMFMIFSLPGQQCMNDSVCVGKNFFQFTKIFHLSHIYLDRHGLDGRSIPSNSGEIIYSMKTRSFLWLHDLFLLNCMSVPFLFVYGQAPFPNIFMVFVL